MIKNVLLICCFLFTCLNAFSQNGKYQNMTPKDRAEIYTELMKTYLNLSKVQATKVATINLKSAFELEKLKSDDISKINKWNRAKKIQKQRETAFESILNKVQMKKYIEKKKEMFLQFRK